MKTSCALVVALLWSCAVASAQSSHPAAPAQRSISRIAFGPPGVLFAADWKAGRVYAYRLAPATAAADRPFNLRALQGPLAAALGNARFKIRDLAMRPGSAEAYLAIESGAAEVPAIVRVTPDGTVRKLDLASLGANSTALEKAGGSLEFWDRVPETAYTVTDMKWHAGRLYVAGLANQAFSSTLRILSYPFARQTMASIEIYHTVHDQYETRAPIRAMTFATVGGADTLLAGYLCSPLVAIPVAKLADGAHVRAKTLAELGVAGIPTSMLVYDQPDMTGKKSYPFVLVNERYRPSVAIPLGGIAKVDAGPGITSPPSMMAPAGADVGAIVEDFDGVSHIDNQDANFFIALRRDLDSGEPQLVSYDKHASFRLSDADLSDYDFPDYKYAGRFQRDVILPLQNMLKKEEGFPDLTIPQ